MNNEERMYLLEECIKQFRTAKIIQLQDQYEFLMRYGAGMKLKEIIEKYIDCQPKKYYDKYIKIVELYKQF